MTPVEQPCVLDLLMLAEEADHMLREHLDNFGQLHDRRWHALRGMRQRAWDAYMRAAHPSEALASVDLHEETA